MAPISSYTSAVRNRVCYGIAKPPVKEACAEFLATFVLVVLGDGVMASCVLGRLNLHSVITGAFGWGFALMIAVLIAGGISGGHVNPAVTVALASARKCSWKHIGPYISAQYVASFLAAAVVYLVYKDAIAEFDGGFRQIPPSVNATAHIFATYPQDFASISTCVFDQILGSALLLMVICAAIDTRNLRVPPHTQPMIIGLGLTVILLAFGFNCGAPLNPARDLAPRIFTALSGWGTAVFSFRNYEWFWVPIVAPHVGAILGVWLYKAFVELPFVNYSQLLQELDSPDYEEERKHSEKLDEPKAYSERVSSPDVKVGKSIANGTSKIQIEEARPASCVISDLEIPISKDSKSGGSDEILTSFEEK